MFKGQIRGVVEGGRLNEEMGRNPYQFPLSLLFRKQSVFQCGGNTGLV